MRRKILLLLFFFTALLKETSYSAPYPFEPAVQEIGTCIVINAKTGKVLFEKNAHDTIFPASCTKAATLLYITSRANLDLKLRFTVPKEAVRIVKDAEKARDNFSRYPSYLQEATGTSAYLKEGEILTIEEALYGMMLVSGNDAANALAHHFGNGSIESFMTDLNRFLKKIGCTSTFLQNPHGLHHPKHVSSAYDLALIARYGMQSIPLFRQVVGTKSYTKPTTNKQGPITWNQRNRLLQKGRFYCEWATGVKTGRHARAMENIIASGQKNDREIIAVFMKCPDKFKLYETARTALSFFLTEEKKKVPIITKGPIKLTRKLPDGSSLRLTTTEGYIVETYPSELPNITVEAEWLKPSRITKKGTLIGSLLLSLDGLETKKINLLAEEDHTISFPSFLAYLCSDICASGKKWTWMCPLLFVLLSLMLMYARIALKKR